MAFSRRVTGGNGGRVKPRRSGSGGAAEDFLYVRGPKPPQAFGTNFESV